MTTIRLITILVIIILIVVSGYLLFRSPESKVNLPVNSGIEKEVDLEAITGRWQRTDGGYIVELGSVHNNGTLDAAYYNPQPINVSVSQWHSENERIKIYIELSDVNYPGSYYKLEYFPQQDQLVGIYFQAIYKQTFDVQFMRMKE